MAPDASGFREETRAGKRRRGGRRSYRPDSDLRRSRSRARDILVLASDVASARPHAITVILDFDADRMPATILLPRGGVSKVVLLAQLVGDARRRGIEVARIADDLR